MNEYPIVKYGIGYHPYSIFCELVKKKFMICRKVKKRVPRERKIRGIFTRAGLSPVSPASPVVRREG